MDGALGERMTGLLRHRGPDGHGSMVVAADPAHPGPTLYLGHRRLSIIDLSEAAAQPLPNEDRTVWVVFNGEIYNFRGLRADLERSGHRFGSHTDSEVIVHAYEQYGDGFVARLDGMFAFVLWDSKRRRLILARDRSGKKPLFHAFDGRTFTFGSEIKAMLACPWVGRDVATGHLAEYLTFGCVRSPATLFRDVATLPPGTSLTVEDGRPGAPVRYWDLREVMAKPNRPSERAAAEQVRTLLTRAVETRLVSDVPLGALLSGGLDSTIVVGLMARLCPEPIQTFAIGFADDASFDERPYAATAARAFGTRHTEFVVRTDASALMARLLWHHDQPYGDSSALPTYVVSRLARRHVKVVLNGDGGDEVFGGYERFRAALWAERIPPFASTLAGLAARALPRNDGYFGVRRRVERFAAGSDQPPVNRYLGWLAICDPGLVARLLRPEFLAGGSGSDVIAQMATSAGAGAGDGLLDRLLHLNFTTYLPDDLLVKVDRMSMANSLEARSPMLDTALVEYMASLPDGFKIGGGRLKVLLREAFRDLVPPELLNRAKHGFGIPVDRWFRGELRGMAEALLEPASRIHAYLEPTVLRRLVDEHARGGRSHGHRLWALVNLELWCRMLEDGSLSRPISEDVTSGWEAEVVTQA